LERQVIVAGKAGKLSAAESLKYFVTRPKASNEHVGDGALTRRPERFFATWSAQRGKAFSVAPESRHLGESGWGMPGRKQNAFVGN
jgi:hypothetical protein